MRVAAARVQKRRAFVGPAVLGLSTEPYAVLVSEPEPDEIVATPTTPTQRFRRAVVSCASIAATTGHYDQARLVASSAIAGAAPRILL
jgi:hypothetical protein